MCARKAGASVNGISRKQQRVRACCGRADVNGRAREHAFLRLDRAPEHQRSRRVLVWPCIEGVRADRRFSSLSRR